MKPSGIGGQAVIEGIMMRNKSMYSVAVRKPDGQIEVIRKKNRLKTEKYKFLDVPVVRGIFNFVDSLVLGIRTLTYSSSFYEDEETQKDTRVDELGKTIFKDKFESVLMAVTILFSVALAVGIFMVLPYFISRLMANVIVSRGVLNLIEGIIRIIIFVAYMLLISLMKDIRRVFMYHGAEHKCINCIESGLELNTANVRKSSKEHKRCGTSFMLLVMFVSVIFFIFIHLGNPVMQVLVRILLVPVIAGVSYELIRWAGRNDNRLVRIVSAPGMWLQRLSTKEPDDDMIEVAIRAVEAVFDWQAFLEKYDTLEDYPCAAPKKEKAAQKLVKPLKKGKKDGDAQEGNAPDGAKEEKNPAGNAIHQIQTAKEEACITDARPEELSEESYNALPDILEDVEPEERAQSEEEEEFDLEIPIFKNRQKKN